MFTFVTGNSSSLDNSREGTSATLPLFVAGVSRVMRELEQTIADIAPTNIRVLLAGESGTGKEVLALEIHRLSQRKAGAFQKCSCAALTTEELRSHLKLGDGSKANGDTEVGTLLLDEISHLDRDCQRRLLTLLPEGNGVGAAQDTFPRLIATTVRDLSAEVRRGEFLAELYYRVNGVTLRLPPLHERKEDIPLLADFFLKKYASLFGRPVPSLDPAALDSLVGHPWPGNVRELENIARKMVALGNSQLALMDLKQAVVLPLEGRHVLKAAAPRKHGTSSLKEASREACRRAERELIVESLERNRWNRTRAARDLQISYKALLYKLKQLGLTGSKES
jgi:two-component system, NtrC family, response regulator AtoC